MAHPDLDHLLDVAVKFAQEMLARRGAFFPFGCSMNTEGEIIMDASYSGGEHPPSQELIEALAGGYAQKANAGVLRAAAICADVRVVPPGAAAKTDAISVALEHSSGEAVTVFLPYSKSWFGRVRYGNLFASEKILQFFEAPGPV